MLDSLDNVKTKLARMHQTMEKRREIMRTTASAEAVKSKANAETPQAKAGCQASDVRGAHPKHVKKNEPDFRVQMPQEGLWQKMRVQLHCPMRDAGDRYTL